MYVRWRSITAITIVTAAALVVPGLVAASPQEAPSPAVKSEQDTTSAVGGELRPTLDPVTVHEVDPAILAAAPSGGGGTVTQTIRVAVLGGSLELLTQKLTVPLAPVPGSDRVWHATLPPVRVVDARGTHEGWTVRWFVETVEIQGVSTGAVPPARVVVEPAPPVVVAGAADGLRAGRPAHGLQRGSVLFAADPGSGGGTYEGGGSVSLRLPAGHDVDGITVKLAFKIV